MKLIFMTIYFHLCTFLKASSPFRHCMKARKSYSRIEAATPLP